jgi:hypothetical protein
MVVSRLVLLAERAAQMQPDSHAYVSMRNTQERTSYREDEVDALARKAEEGRGDRRNVQGELHASDEP